MKSVCVVTVSRADYGLLRWVIQQINSSPRLSLQLLVTGAHFSSDQGRTVQEIQNDGFHIDARIPMAPENSTATDITSALGRGLEEIGLYLARRQPDIVVLLGDRSETMIAGIASTILGIPIAHIHGGEVTLGAIDDAFRHSLTKMSHLHFVANEEYKSRVLQLGEDPARVFNVGSLGHESTLRIGRLSKSEVQAKLGIFFGMRNLLLTVHPETLTSENNSLLLAAFEQVINALGDTHFFITGTNVDHGGDDFNRLWRRLSEANPNVWFFESLGTRLYLSLMSLVDAVVGNSSSGVLEAPVLGIPTINVGFRQAGRVMAHSVKNVPPDGEVIISAIGNLKQRKGTPAKLSKSDNTQRSIYPSEMIVTEIERHCPKTLWRKNFFDYGR